LSSLESLLKRLYEIPLFRADMGAVRVPIPAFLLTFLSILLKDPTILQKYAWLNPLPVATEKYVRETLEQRKKA